MYLLTQNKNFHLLHFFFNDTAPTEIYTLSLHDALPISDEVVRLTAWQEGVDGSSPSAGLQNPRWGVLQARGRDRKSTRLNSSHPSISYAVFCLKKKKIIEQNLGPHIEYKCASLQPYSGR